MITLTFTIFGSIFAKKDLVPLYKNEEWVGFFLYLALLCLGLTIAILSDFKVQIPNPIDPIRKLIEFILGIEE
ncbi:MAG: hypothetical protein GX389_01275 [Clostridiaceae bacterium]|nr:hypothetical protein [Clostridiaceae bacterium]